MKLIWRPEAEADVEAIFNYIAERNERAARDLRERINGIAERLTETPYLFRRGRIPGTREAVIHPNYIVIYEVGTETVEIVGVIHARRRYPPDDIA